MSLRSYHDTFEGSNFYPEADVLRLRHQEDLIGAQAGALTPPLEKTVADVLKWCRTSALEPLPAEAVPGTNERERRLLSALGGIANALAQKTSRLTSSIEIPDEVSKWLHGCPEPPAELIENLVAHLSGRIDPLAAVYERIVAGPRRRKLGTFFTPVAVLEYMQSIISHGIDESPQTVVDPGAGVGAFTTGSLTWWPNAEVHAIDVNLVTLGLLATRPDLDTAQSSSAQSARIKLKQDDFLSWLHSTWPTLTGPRLIFGNPPYTRHQQLTQSQKKHAQSISDVLAPGQRAGLSTYFLAAGLKALAERDSLCMLLPVNWLEADYARPIRRHLWQASDRKIELHLFPNQLGIFPGAQVAAMVIFVGPAKTEEQPLLFQNVVKRSEKKFVGSPPKIISRVGSSPASFNAEALLTSRKLVRRPKKTVPLAQHVHIRRGVATGANAFFLRTYEEKVSLGDQFTVPAISRLRELSTDLLDQSAHDLLSTTGARCWILNLTKEDEEKPIINSLLTQGIADGINLRYLCKIRDPWFSVEKIPTPHLLLGPMGKNGFRVVTNKIGAVPTNTLYGMRLRTDTSPQAIERLAQWLQGPEGQSSLKGVARQHGDGLLKVEPGPLGTVQIPASLIDQ